MKREQLEDLALWSIAAAACGFCATLWPGVPRVSCAVLSALCVVGFIATAAGAKGGAA